MLGKDDYGGANDPRQAVKQNFGGNGRLNDSSRQIDAKTLPKHRKSAFASR
jgi:hypothetical protein